MCEWIIARADAAERYRSLLERLNTTALGRGDSDSDAYARGGLIEADDE